MADTPIPDAIRHLLFPSARGGAASDCHSGVPKVSLTSSYSGVPKGSLTSTYSSDVPIGSVSSSYSGVPKGSLTSTYSSDVPTGGVTSSYSGVPKGSVTSSYSSDIPTGGITSSYSGIPVNSVSSTYSSGDTRGGATSSYSAGGGITSSYSGLQKDSVSSTHSKAPIEGMISIDASLDAEARVHEDPQAALFFLEKDLQRGTKMRLNLGDAESRILSRSVEREAMEQLLRECSAPAVKGETRRCVTSLHSMVEFSKEMLGTRRLTAVSTEIGGEGGGGWKEYGVTKVERVPGASAVACHLQPYVYAVFSCHSTGATRVYMVGLEREGGGGGAAAAVAVCHEDTAGWNPTHVAFQVLKVKPGTLAVCHVLPRDTLVWAPKE